MLVQFKKHLYQPLMLIMSVFFFLSCQKDIDLQTTSPLPETVTPDLTTRTNSSVSGFVTDENNTAVIGADVKVGNSTTTTDKYGYFEARNADVVKNAALVTVTKPGYFKGIKTYIATEGKSAFFRIKLIPKTTAGTISGSAGGNVTLSNGMIVTLPADAVMNAGTNAAYTGSINVAVTWIDPTSPELNKVMPGDLRAIDDAGSLKRLTTYGMAAIELTSGSGELLQIASGKKATLTIPLPSALSASAPSSIALWYFDETNGLWKQQGTAIKTGNAYVGEVSHFSFWNCDVPNNYIQFNCTVVNSAGTPIPYAEVKISVVGDPNNSRWGYTDSAGYVSGAIPDNAQLLLEIFSYYTCGNVLYSQNFTTTNTNISLGTITVNSISSLATVTGSVTNCASNPVTNGYIIMNSDNVYYHYPLSSTGTFSFNTLMCSSPVAVTFIAEDIDSLQQSAPLSYSLVSGNNNIGNLQACGVSTAQFLTYSINGSTSITFVPPVDSLFQYGNGGTTGSSYIGGFNSTNGSIYFVMDNTGIGVGSMQPLSSLTASQIGENITVAGISVNITEYGAVGEFISGNFTGTALGVASPYNPYVITCSFRVRRSI